MGDKIAINRKFHQEDLERWQQSADREASGNLTRWMEDRLNEVRGPMKTILKRLSRIEKKLDEVLGEYVNWE